MLLSAVAMVSMCKWTQPQGLAVCVHLQVPASHSAACVGGLDASQLASSCHGVGCCVQGEGCTAGRLFC